METGIGTLSIDGECGEYQISSTKIMLNITNE